MDLCLRNCPLYFSYKQNNTVHNIISAFSVRPLSFYMTPQREFVKGIMSKIQLTCGTIYIRTHNPKYVNFPDTFGKKMYRQVDDPIKLFAEFRRILQCENKTVFLATDSLKLRMQLAAVDTKVLYYTHPITHVQKSPTVSFDGVLIDWLALMFSRNIAGTESSFLFSALCFFSVSRTIHTWVAGDVKILDVCKSLK